MKSNLTKNVRIPLETMSSFKNRIYVTVNEKGPKSIAFYNKDGSIRRQIDLDHMHLGEKPHVHEGDVSQHQKDFKVKMTKSDKSYIRKVKRLWREYNDHGRN